MCTTFEEESKGQSNRELHADFLSLFESAPELTLGPEIGSAIKRRNATDDQVTRALEVIIQGMILEKKLEGTRQEGRMYSSGARSWALRGCYSVWAYGVS